MSARPTWKGFLKISLVSIPIKVYPATESSESISFNQLHDSCQTRVTQRKWCVSCGREVPSAEIVKGFEFAKGRYVILRPEELDAVQPPSTRLIDLTQFAKASTLEPIYVDRAYYLAPDGPLAANAYAVLCASMEDLVGLGKLALYGREYLIAVRQRQHLRGALMLYTLHHASEIRPIDAIDDLQALPRAVKIDEVKLAQQVIAAFTGPLNLADFRDDYQADLRRLIDAKIAGEEIVEPTPIDTPRVDDLTTALRESLALLRATKTPSANAAPIKRKRAS